MSEPSGSLSPALDVSCDVTPQPTLASHKQETALWLRWLKFNFVGGLGIVIQFAALFLLKSILHFHYLAATAIAVEAAVMHNFVWHEQFTWADRIGRERHRSAAPRWRASLPRLWRFHLGNGLVSIVGNLALMKAMVGEGHMNYLLANAIAIALCSIANFLVSEEWVFSEGR
jgi:putative flippase GtrA